MEINDGIILVNPLQHTSIYVIRKLLFTPSLSPNNQVYSPHRLDFVVKLLTDDELCVDCFRQ